MAGAFSGLASEAGGASSTANLMLDIIPNNMAVPGIFVIACLISMSMGTSVGTISVIVPIYNVAPYLRKCVDSLLVQDILDYEIILVDDGSTDSSGTICDEYAEKYSQVSVVHKENGGLSDARNVGLNHTSGEYVIFMDSDDFWSDKDDLTKLVDVAKESPECDFIGFNCSYFNDTDGKVVPWVNYNNEIITPIESNNCIDKLVKSGTFPMSACMKLIKRSCIQ